LRATRRIRAVEAETRWAAHADHRAHRNAFEEDRDACSAAGMDGFLTKPLDRERLQRRSRPPLARLRLRLEGRSIYTPRV